MDDNRYGDTEFPLAGENPRCRGACYQILAHNNACLANLARHQYAHCWRCKNPVIYRATEQWFSLCRWVPSASLPDAIDNQITVDPSKWGHDGIFNVVRDRGDWAISRQRILGRANSYLLL